MIFVVFVFCFVNQGLITPNLMDKIQNKSMINSSPTFSKVWTCMITFDGHIHIREFDPNKK